MSIIQCRRALEPNSVFKIAWDYMIIGVVRTPCMLSHPHPTVLNSVFIEPRACALAPTCINTRAHVLCSVHVVMVSCCIACMSCVLLNGLLPCSSVGVAIHHRSSSVPYVYSAVYKYAFYAHVCVGMRRVIQCRGLSANVI